MHDDALTPPAPLPADLDTMSRRDLVALAEERGVRVTARAVLDDIRWNIRQEWQRDTVRYRHAQNEAVRAEWQVAHPPVPESEGAQVLKDALWGLANLSGTLHSPHEELLRVLEHEAPVLEAFFRGDARVTKHDAATSAGRLTRAIERVRIKRQEADEYASFTMGSAARRLAAMNATAGKASDDPSNNGGSTPAIDKCVNLS
jgi:hypothetical protein